MKSYGILRDENSSNCPVSTFFDHLENKQTRSAESGSTLPSLMPAATQKSRKSQEDHKNYQKSNKSQNHKKIAKNTKKSQKLQKITKNHMHLFFTKITKKITNITKKIIKVSRKTKF